MSVGRAGRLVVAVVLAAGCGPTREGACRSGDCAGARDASAREAVPMSDAGVDARPGAPLPDGRAPWLEIGRGDDSFQALDEDGRVSLVLGPQGSWMSFFALRGAGFVPERTEVELRAWLDAVLIGNMRGVIDFAVVGAALETSELTLIYDRDITPMTMSGRAVELEATVTDAGGRVLGTTAMVQPRK